MTAAIDPKTLSLAQRTTLEEWRTQLEKLLARRAATHWRGEVDRNLRNHLRSSLKGTYEAIAEAGSGLVSDFTKRVIETMRPFCGTEDEARACALSVPALVDLKFTLMGPDPDDTIAVLTQQAIEAIDVLEAILKGRVIWTFPEVGPAK